MNEPITTDTTDSKGPSQHHFYGYDIRKHFLAATVMLVITILVDKEMLNFNILVGVAGIFIIVMLAGLTTPKNRPVMIADLIVSGIMFVLFEYIAIAAYLKADSFFSIVFILRQAIALIFLGALYLSTKTVRDML
jgi:hypothetical protein